MAAARRHRASSICLHCSTPVASVPQPPAAGSAMASARVASRGGRAASAQPSTSLVLRPAGRDQVWLRHAPRDDPRGGPGHPAAAPDRRVPQAARPGRGPIGARGRRGDLAGRRGRATRGQRASPASRAAGRRRGPRGGALGRGRSPRHRGRSGSGSRAARRRGGGRLERGRGGRHRRPRVCVAAHERPGARGDPRRDAATRARGERGAGGRRADRAPARRVGRRPRRGAPTSPCVHVLGPGLRGALPGRGCLVGDVYIPGPATGRGAARARAPRAAGTTSEAWRRTSRRTSRGCGRDRFPVVDRRRGERRRWGADRRRRSSVPGPIVTGEGRAASGRVWPVRERGGPGARRGLCAGARRREGVDVRSCYARA